MTRDELAARLFVEMAREYRHAFLRDFPCLDDAGRRALAEDVFDLADAFEAERKRRLTEPEGVK